MTSSASQISTALAQALERYRAIVVAYLFGSAARSETTSLSDLDVAVLVEAGSALSPRQRGRIAEDLAAAAGVDRVDLVSLTDADPTLIARVLRDGVILTCRDHSARVRFETRALGEYMDLAPMRRVLDRGRLKEIREGRLLG